MDIQIYLKQNKDQIVWIDRERPSKVLEYNYNCTIQKAMHPIADSFKKSLPFVESFHSK